MCVNLIRAIFKTLGLLFELIEKLARRKDMKIRVNSQKRYPREQREIPLL